MINVYFDGGTDGLQTCVIFDGDIPRTFNHKYAHKLTNNELEYQAVIDALQMVEAETKPTEVVIHGDSEVIIRHLQGEYQVKAENLKPYYSDAKKLENQLRMKGYVITYKWIPRHINKAGIYIENVQKQERHKKLIAMAPVVDNKCGLCMGINPPHPMDEYHKFLDELRMAGEHLEKAYAIADKGLPSIVHDLAHEIEHIRKLQCLGKRI